MYISGRTHCEGCCLPLFHQHHFIDVTAFSDHRGSHQKDDNGELKYANLSWICCPCSQESLDPKTALSSEEFMATLEYHGVFYNTKMVDRRQHGLIR